MKKILSTLLASLLLVSGFTFGAGAAETDENTEAAEETVGYKKSEGKLEIYYAPICAGTVNKHPSADVEVVEFDGREVVKVTPRPDTTDIKEIALDSWNFDKYPEKAELPRYKYIGVTYYYDTDYPSFTGKPRLQILPGSTKVVIGGIPRDSVNTVTTGEWAEVVYSLENQYVLNEETNTKYVKQIHFMPYGSTDSRTLIGTDTMYIEKFTFYEYDPGAQMSYLVHMMKGLPEATGETPKPTPVKFGDIVTAPENPYTLADGEFKGWKTSVTGNTLVQPGEEVKVGNGDLVFTAVWHREVDHAEFIAIDFADYHNGIAGKTDSATLETVEYEGKKALKIVPNTKSAEKCIDIDGWRYANAGIDLSAYKHIAVVYKYESEKPVKTKMSAWYMMNGDILTGFIFNTSKDYITAGEWTFATIDMSHVDSRLNPISENHVLRQMRFYPLGEDIAPAQMSEGDAMYISQLIFFKDKPALEIHSPYMTGYTDGSFKPDKTMSRAEACTVVARVLEAEENISGTPSFADSKAHWAAKYIGFCEAKGILKSYSGNFEPNKAITRAEFAELVYNTGLAKADPEKVKTFTDVKSDHPKFDAINAASSAGLIGGYSDGTFLPDREVTRAQVVTIINRARGRDMTKETVSDSFSSIFTDLDNTSWAFANVAEAAVPHVEMEGKWMYAMKNPEDGLKNTLEENYKPDYAAANAKIAETDKLTEERIAEIRASKSEVKISGTTYYVSPKGDDANDGTSPDKAWKTAERTMKAKMKPGDAVLFERGGLWREKFNAQAGVTYSAYGEGAKPMFYGSPENGADASGWTLFHEGADGSKIWKYQNESMQDIGEIILDNGAAYTYRETPNFVGGEYVLRNDPATKFDFTKHLTRNLSFFHATNGSNLESTGAVYLRCDKGNPGELYDSIEFNIRGSILSVPGDGITVDNLCFKYVGSFAISAGSVKNLTVTNCEIGYIGGNIQHYTDGRPVRLGNGVQIYGSCDGYYIDNCYVYECYDAGITPQYSGHRDTCTMYNIEFTDNVIENCVYNIEYFLGVGEDRTEKRDGKNFLIEGNILRKAGFGWGSTRPDGGAHAHIKGWNSSRNEFENFVIKNNIFDRSVAALVESVAGHKLWLPKYEGNTYIQGYKNRLFGFGVGDGKHYENDVFGEKYIKEILGDTTGSYYVSENIPEYEFPKFD